MASLSAVKAAAQTAEQPPNLRLQAVIQAFIQHYNFLHEKRLQKLLFCLEYMAYERTGKPALGIPFRRYHYGVFSDNVRLALSQTSDLETGQDVAEDGTPVMVFRPTAGMSPPLDGNLLELVEAVHAWTKSMTTDQLAWFGKSTTAWEETHFGEEIDFERLVTTPGFRTNKEDHDELIALKKEILSNKVHSYADDDELLRDLQLA